MPRGFVALCHAVWLLSLNSSLSLSLSTRGTTCEGRALGGLVCFWDPGGVYPGGGVALLRSCPLVLGCASLVGPFPLGAWAFSGCCCAPFLSLSPSSNSIEVFRCVPGKAEDGCRASESVRPICCCSGLRAGLHRVLYNDVTSISMQSMTTFNLEVARPM